MKRLLHICMAIALLMSASCEKEKRDPYYVIWFSATVVDEAGEPIQGIHLYPENAEFVGRTGYTDHNGKIAARSYTEPRKRWIICVEDIDGEYNRGTYESKEIDITGKVAPATKPDEWGYSGSCSVDIGTITLKKL